MKLISAVVAEVDAQHYREVMGQFATGIAVISPAACRACGPSLKILADAPVFVAPLLFYGGRYARVDRGQPIEELVPPTIW